MANLPLFIKHTGSNWNIRSAPNTLQDPIGQLEVGMLFTQSQRFDESHSTEMKIDVNENGCEWIDGGLFGSTDTHNYTQFARIDGYFRNLGYHLSAYSAYWHGQGHFDKTAAYRHTQGSYHGSDWGSGWSMFADNSSYLQACSKPFINHIYDSLRAKGWDGVSNVSYMNFAHRNGYYAVRLRYQANYYDGTGNLLGYCSAGSWVYFTWANPPVTGSANKSWVRTVGFTQSDDPVWGTFLHQNETIFFDADLDYTSATPLWHGYNISTMIDD